MLASLDADIMLVVAYGLLLPQAVLDIPKLGVLMFTALCFLNGAVPHLFSAL